MTSVNEKNNKTKTDAKSKKTKPSTNSKSQSATAESTETAGTDNTVEITEAETKVEGEGEVAGKTTEKLESSLALEFTIEIKKEEIEKQFNETLDKYAADIKLPGFRKGKAPIDVVRNRFKDAVQEEVINQAINEAVMAKIEKEKLRVLSKPTVKKLDYEEGKDLKADMVMEVLPEIVVPDLETLEVEIPIKDLEHEPFDEPKAIDQVLEAHMREVPVTDRGIKENDIVSLKYQSKILTTKRIDRTKTNYYMVTNKNIFEIIDLYDDILGKNTHDHLDLKRTYPVDYKKKIWAGKEVEHYIDIEGIFEMVKPELDEKFLKTLGIKDETEFKQKLKDEYEEHTKTHTEDKKIGFIIDRLNEIMDFPLPNTIVEEEMGRMIKANPYQFTMNSQDINERKKAIDALKTRAEKSVRFTFIVEAIKDKYNLKVTSEDLENHYKTIAAKNHMEYKDIRNFYMKPENKSYLEDELLRSKVLNLLKEKIKIKEV